MRNQLIGAKTHEFFGLLQEFSATLVYQGFFDQEIVKSFLRMAENRLKEENADDTVRKKLFAVVTEALQNICKHQKTDGETANAIFMLGRDRERYMIVTGNLIRDEKIGFVKEKIDKVNSLDKDGLKEFYKQARLSSEISDVGGAGLGFIDMARKSGNRLEYYFEPVGAATSFFTLLSTITIN